ncbi:uncharacterized protein BO87DRAFT_186881 [Aspergillus neoniger CBS 115656]|uniref:Uncharacterized protein n=1 Tax=Aspergillus neoniger (strain CBS 115656) TaxID=1448310 RepID=A0A318YTZ0_ASPNB|nr:hypothetical protein BO87DRAFT_186881 [Aspergillus neoniger CBS 115656]PYH37819.1 hypothetical protein BO87DRAFT_186881 [Aspergillus neoniger CBS 115656]
MMEESSKHPVAFKIGQAFHGLELSEQLPTFIPEEASEDDTSSEYVDIVHVMGISRPERMSLEAVFGDHFTSHAERREFVYQSNASHFLLGDLTGYYVEKEALQLLAGLLQFRPSSVGKSSYSRSIIFIAYELGALVVERAVALSGSHQTIWTSIFTDTVRFVS